MIPFIHTFQEVLEKIENSGIPYIVVGSLASMVYGEPRMTRDMDLVVDVGAADAKKFSALFPQPEFYCPPDEILFEEIRNRGQFNLLHPSTGLKIDIVIKKLSPFDLSRFSRRRKIMLWENFSAYLASPEDIIIKKLEFYRDGKSEKHLRDIQGIITNTELDQEYLGKWIEQLNLKTEWAKAQ